MSNNTFPSILIVDDDGLLRITLARVVEGWGFQVNEAEDGQKALDFVQANPVDLILMDLQMPRMDGITALREIHKFNPAIPVLIMSGHLSALAGIEVLESGALDYLAKPFDLDSLKLSFERVMRTQTPVQKMELNSSLPIGEIPVS